MSDTEGARFPTTHLSLIELANQKDHPRFQEVWETFFRGYWKPLYAHLRRRGSPEADALDLLQELFMEGLHGNLLASYDPAKGRFRSYLIGCLRHRHLSERRSLRARPDRQTHSFLSGDDDELKFAPVDDSNEPPERTFEREWALQVLDCSVAALEQRLQAEADHVSLRILREWVLRTERGLAEDLASAMRLEKGALYTRATRLRQALLDEVEAQVRQYSPGAAEAGLECAEVLRCLTE